MIKLAISVVSIFIMLIVYSCCVVAGRSDDTTDKWMKDIMNEKREGD